MPVSPLTENTDIVTFSVQSNGKDIPDTYAVISIKINQEVNNVDVAEIELVDGDQFDKGFIISESDTFLPGTQITIKIGYESVRQPVFNGIVTGQAIRINNESGPILKVTCKNAAVRENPAQHDVIPGSELKLEYGVDVIDCELEWDGEHASSVLTKFRGFIRFRGSAKAVVNSMIEVKGLGKRFLEDVYISGVEHLVKEGNWITKIQIGILPHLV